MKAAFTEWNGALLAEGKGIKFIEATNESQQFLAEHAGIKVTVGPLPDSRR